MTLRRNDADYVRWCFAEPAHAERFRERFGGEIATYNLSDNAANKG